jgi:hypothetical protein
MTGIMRSERALVAVYVEPYDGRGYTPYVYTDYAGRYTLKGLPKDAVVRLTVEKEGFVNQCALPPLVLSDDVVVDREIVALGLQATSHSAVQPTEGLRTVSGVVRRGRDLEAGANMLVVYETRDYVQAAYTFTDQDGRYLLCGIPRNQTALIAAYRGFENGEWLEVPAGESTEKADFDMAY